MGHLELPGKEKTKFESEEKKVQLSTENGDLLSFLATKLHFQC